MIDIPSEVRLRIYRSDFRTVNIIIHNADHIHPCQSRPGDKCNAISIIDTCKQVREEAQDFLFSQADCYIVKCACWEDYFRCMSSLIRTAPESILRVKHLTFQEGNSFVFREMHLPKLIDMGLNLNVLRLQQKLWYHLAPREYGYCCRTSSTDR